MIHRMRPEQQPSEPARVPLGGALRRGAFLAVILIGLLAVGGGAGVTSALMNATARNSANVLANTTISAPTGLAASASAGAMQISLTWVSSPSSWATGYIILRSNCSGLFSEVARVTPVSASSFSDGSISLNVSYCYKIQTYHRQWTSSLTSAVTATTQVTVTIGDDVLEPTNDSSSAGTAQAFSYYQPSGASITKLTIFLASSNTAAPVIVGIYKDKGGSPNSLLASGSIASPVSGAWNTVTISAVTLKKGTYWIAVLSPVGGGTVQFRDQAGGTSETSLQTNLSSLPATWTTGTTWSSSNMSAFGSP